MTTGQRSGRVTTVALERAGTPAAAEAPLPDPVRLAQLFLLEHDGATREAYARDLRSWFAWCAALGVDPLVAGRGHVAEHRRQLLEDLHRKPATVARRLAALAGFYRYAVDAGALERSPVPDRRRLTVDDTSTSLGVSAAELQALIQAAGSRGQDAVALVLLLGLNGCASPKSSNAT